MSQWGFFTAVFLLTLLGTGLFRQLALKVQLLDRPTSRSAHVQPVPVGGGLIIVLLFGAAAVYFHLSGLLAYNQLMIAMAALFIGGVGMLDDFWSLHVAWRVPLQTLAAVWVVAWLGGVGPINMGGVILGNQLILSILAVLALLWLLNLYNFMDGIDGLAGSELLFVTFLSFSLVINSGDQVVSALSATLFSAGAGFLVWNWPPAKLFMGDVGSSFIGFSLGILALFSMQTGSLSVWTWVILLAVFIADASVTLARRYQRGEKWYEGHASHAYQHAARHYKSHRRVTITITGINCLWLAPLAWCSVNWSEAAMYIAVLALAPLVVLAIKLGAGKNN
ncbi:MAG: glycosyltransferase family 4 protein [Gammaproteobacteria bacterium]